MGSAETCLNPSISSAQIDSGRKVELLRRQAIEVGLETLLGVDLSGTPLGTHAFNPAVLKPGEKRLRFIGYEERTQAWTNAHRGAMHFAQGCMLRLLNLAEHHEEFGRDEALEAGD